MGSDTTQTEHTPGPWLYDCEDYCLVVAGGEPICQLWNKREEEYQNAEANARRIVACVNACEGISTEALEQGVISDLLEALKAMVCNRCENRVGYSGPATQYGDWRSCSSCAAPRAALTKAREGQYQ